MEGDVVIAKKESQIKQYQKVLFFLSPTLCSVGTHPVPHLHDINPLTLSD